MLNLQRVKKDMEKPVAAALHAKLRQAIHAQIMDGTLGPGESLPSERVIQEHLGMSRTTIRKAIDTLTQAGLLQSIPSTGTFVLEREDKPASMGTIALIVSEANFHFFYPDLAASFNKRIRQADYGLAMSFYSEDTDTLSTSIDESLAQDVSALAITPPRIGNVEPLVGRLRQIGIPFVFIARRSPNLAVDSVATDNKQIGYEATQHLIQLGHRRIIHAGFLDYTTGEDRAAGYLRAMKEFNLEPRIVELPLGQVLPPAEDTPAEYVFDEPGYQAVAREVWQASNSYNLPTGIFCFNDLAALGIYSALRELSVRIPQDLSLVSVDNLPTIRHLEVPLTTVALPGKEIGYQGAELLLRRLSGEEFPPQNHLLPGRLIKRLSTAPAPLSQQ